MPLLICVCLAWLTIILFAIVPKRLSILDFVFLYFILLSFTSTSFTILELNFHIIKIPIPSQDLWALTVFRVLTVPLQILIAINVLQPFDKRKRRLILASVIWMALTLHDWALYHFNIIHYHLLYTWPLLALAYLVLMLITWCVTWWYTRFDHRKVRPS